MEFEENPQDNFSRVNYTYRFFFLIYTLVIMPLYNCRLCFHTLFSQVNYFSSKFLL